MVALIVFLPLFGALFTGLFCRTIPHRLAQVLTSGLMVLSAILAGIVFVDVAIHHNSYTVQLLRWMDVGLFKAGWALKVDSLTAVMLVVVTWVSTLVHIYSIGYMSHDPHIPRFMSYLSLFTFFMLMLVTSDNLVQLFLGWEGVGLCSYLLIGFWYSRPSANAAAMKAFIVNRVGDFGFALGIFTLFLVFGSVQFDHIFPYVAQYQATEISFFGYSFPVLEAICILLFIGSMGKSAQFGLHTWLPDAMEGPTPVSALIHAATMVTAGVFLVARCSPLFEYAPTALSIVTAVGAFTALFAATVAITQNDIKRIIAYSTCSQLGYMFFACGVSAYSAGIFHLMTHAFFKALLFLGAGSVIHAMSDEQDIRNMGGIWKKIPLTYSLMWIGSLALAGIFPFAGYYSKDVILEAAYASGTGIGQLAALIGLVVAFLTAFYSARLLFIVFHGEPRARDEVMHHVHESPAVILFPLIMLALGAVFAGLAGYYLYGMVEHEGEFWGNALFVLPSNDPLEKAHHLPKLIALLPTVAAVSGLLLAFICYQLVPSIPRYTQTLLKPLYLFSLNKWYIDELYDAILVRPLKRLSLFLWQVVDVRLIDGLGPNGSAWASKKLAFYLNKTQSGYVYHYAFIMLIGLVGLVSWTIFG